MDFSQSPFDTVSSPKFFETPNLFRAWLKANSAKQLELLDGVRKRIDDESYSIRFTPHKPTSIWSALNITKFEQLRAQGRMTVAGEQAFAHRKEHKSVVYAYEQASCAELSIEEHHAFKRKMAAWTYFDSVLAGYKNNLDEFAYLHEYANMRTSLDFPDPMFRHLKAKAALEGVSLRELVLSLIAKGLESPLEKAKKPPTRKLPSISIGAPMALESGQWSNAYLASLLDE